ncbi:hypothetical protein LPB73_07320 [Tardiphaga sp. 37S4]|uniref:hypothetical protein n=1 Tax=Tardiphaga sp. 37S4 TaxID=1404741 RepID=UPI001E55D221|nr:hypothetical protein [Tardiphaga sp. 37S4]UFS77178.1 hypothetical protein LPB73_07320 [Tardiphaga sp. 37S4]
MADRKMILLLKMIDAAHGSIDASDQSHSLLNYFCGDRDRGDDTFNLVAKAGLIRVTHDSRMETSTAYLTDAGRLAISPPDGKVAP